MALSIDKGFAEAPSHYCPRKVLGLIGEGIAPACGLDAPGIFVVWLASRGAVYGHPMPGTRHDIGDMASYEEVKREYRGFTD